MSTVQHDWALSECVSAVNGSAASSLKPRLMPAVHCLKQHPRLTILQWPLRRPADQRTIQPGAAVSSGRLLTSQQRNVYVCTLGINDRDRPLRSNSISNRSATRAHATIRQVTAKADRFQQTTPSIVTLAFSPTFSGPSSCSFMRFCAHAWRLLATLVVTAYNTISFSRARTCSCVTIATGTSLY